MPASGRWAPCDLLVAFAVGTHPAGKSWAELLPDHTLRVTVSIDFLATGHRPAMPEHVCVARHYSREIASSAPLAAENV